MYLPSLLPGPNDWVPLQSHLLPPPRVSRPRLCSHSHTAEAQGLHGVGLTLLSLAQAGLGGDCLRPEHTHHLQVGEEGHRTEFQVL